MKKRSIILRLALWGVVALSVTSCATTKDVENAVLESQNALLASYAVQEGERILIETDVSVPNAATATEGEQGQAWREQVSEKRDAAINRIDVFLTANKDVSGLARTVNALRLRKALLLVVGGEPTRAGTTFGEVDVSLIGNARDLALYKGHEALVWWWVVADKQLSPAVFEPNVKKFVEQLNDVITDSPKGSGIRYYLATLRAHIYLKWSSMSAMQHVKLVEGLAQYSGEFDTTAQDNIKKWSDNDPDTLRSIPTENLRWFGQAEITYDEYSRRYNVFVQEVKDANPQDLDPALRELVESGGLKSSLEEWQECKCSWLAAL